MIKYQLTIGLNDRHAKVQLITGEEAKAKIANTLLKHYGVYAFTMIECTGVYTHTNGAIVNEASIRVEIASDEAIAIKSIIRTLKHKRMLNQESIMLEVNEANINFI